MSRKEGIQLFEGSKASAIAYGVDRDKAEAYAEALYHGGITTIEVPLNAIGSFYMIRDLKKRFGKKMLIGAGNVLDVKDAKDAEEAGASFLAAPNADKRVMKFAASRDLPFLAGALTPEEIVHAWRAGAAFIRLFPASVFGPGYAGQLHMALGHIPLLAAGGIQEDNAADYLRAGCRGVCIGDARFNQEKLEVNDYDAITAQAVALTNLLGSTCVDDEQ